jgi:hypothetical protein
MRVLFAGLVLVAACGGAAAPTPEQQLTAVWVNIDATGTGKILTLAPDGTYVSEAVLATGTNAGNDQVQEGSYTISGDQLGLSPQQSSCPGPQAGYWETWSITGDTLTVSDSTGAASFSRASASPTASGQFTFGCFLSDGFHASPVSPL